MIKNGNEGNDFRLLDDCGGLFLPPSRAPGETFGLFDIQVISDHDFRELAALIRRHFGIRITEDKRVLVTGRIHPIMVTHNFKSHREYLDTLRGDASGAMLSELVDRIATNHTSFFRESAHFDFLVEEALPDLIRRKERERDADLRIWCAACSTGEEAYSLQISLFRYLGSEYGKWKAGVLATDISNDSLETARMGRYQFQRMDGMPEDIKRAYFHPLPGDRYEIDKRIRDEVVFRRFNLTSAEFPFKKPFDVIFCRNVMIYLAQEVRLELLRKLYQWTAPGGYLFIGHSESIIEFEKEEKYAYVKPAVYRKGATP